MARSPNYARIAAQVFDITSRIQAGRLTTYAAIGDELEVPARHVAYILARMDDVPWHRVVREDGGLTGARQQEQRTRLEHEGVRVTRHRVDDLGERFVQLRLDAEHRADPSTPLGRSPRGQSPGEVDNAL